MARSNSDQAALNEARAKDAATKARRMARESQQSFRICNGCGEGFATNVGQPASDPEFLAILKDHRADCAGGFRVATEAEAF